MRLKDIQEYAMSTDIEGLQFVEPVELYAPAILGISDGHWNDDRICVVYDESKIIEIIARDMEPAGDSDDPDDEYNDSMFVAREYFEFNVKGAWVGPHTPIFIYTGEADEDNTTAPTAG